MTVLNLTATGTGFENSFGGISLAFGSGNVSDTVNEYHAYRFSGFSAIPAGATIDSAIATLTVAASTSDEPNHTIRFEDGATTAAISTATDDISARTYTTASVTWSSTDLGAVGGDDFSPPDIKTPLQEVIDSHAPITDCLFSIQGSADSARDLALASSGTKTLDITYTAAGGTLVQDIIGGGLIPFPR